MELSAGGYETVRAHLDESAKVDAARLSKGETVIVSCEGGGMILGSPVLRKCRFANIQAAPEAISGGAQ